MLHLGVAAGIFWNLERQVQCARKNLPLSAPNCELVFDTISFLRGRTTIVAEKRSQHRGIQQPPWDSTATVGFNSHLAPENWLVEYHFQRRLLLVLGRVFLGFP